MNPKREIEITSSVKETLSTKNGLVKGDVLTMYKENVLVDSLIRHADLVEARLTYPTNESVEVTFNLDVIVVTRARYNELKDFEWKYLKLCN